MCNWWGLGEVPGQKIGMTEVGEARCYQEFRRFMFPHQSLDHLCLPNISSEQVCAIQSTVQLQESSGPEFMHLPLL